MDNQDAAVIDVVIRLLPGGDELEVELPLYTTGKEVIEELIRNAVDLNIPTRDSEGNPFTYELSSKGGINVVPEKTLQELGIRSGDILFFAPKLVAG